MRPVRLVNRRHLTVSFLLTHLSVGLSLHSVQIRDNSPRPAARGRASRAIVYSTVRMLHLSLPFLFLTYSWKAKHP